MNTNATTYGQPEEDGRVSIRAAVLLEQWERDSLKLAEAAEQIIGFTTYADHMAREIAGAMLGHPDDQDSRDLAFMRDLRSRVTEHLRNEAREQAEEESKDWPSWRDVLRRRSMRRAA